MKSDSGELQTFVVVTAGSDGAIKLWMLNPAELCPKAKNKKNKDQKKQSTSDEGAKSVGRLLGMYETGSRITCLKAFVMNKASDDDDFDEFSGLSDQKESEPESSSEEDEDD